MDPEYKLKELIVMAKGQGVKHWGIMNKSDLCSALNLEHPKSKSKKFSLTCIMTLEVTTWESSYSISKAYKLDTGRVFYALRFGRLLRTSVGSFVIKKINYSPEGI